MKYIVIKEILGDSCKVVGNTSEEYIFTYNNDKCNSIYKHKDCDVFYEMINNKIIIDDKFMKFIDIWYIYGNLVTARNPDKVYIYGIRFTFDNSNKEVIDFCRSYKEIFGFKENYEYKFQERRKSIIEVLNKNKLDIDFYHPVLGWLFYKLFADKSDLLNVWKKIPIVEAYNKIKNEF